MKCPFSIFLCLLEAFEAETCRECCKKCGNKRFRASKIKKKGTKQFLLICMIP